MHLEWRRACVGLSSGLFQSPSYLLPQLIATIGVSLDSPPAALGWVATLGFVLPLVIGLTQAAGDLVGGRALLLATAALTLAGVTLIALGGIAAAMGAPTTALVAVTLGACLAPAAVRHGALIVAHETRLLPREAQLSESRSLRRYLVLGIYLVPLPAGLVADRYGWQWAFVGLAVVQAASLAGLARLVAATPRPASVAVRAFLMTFARGFADRQLQVTAAGALLAQSTVFAFVAGMPIVLATRGYATSSIAAVALTAVLAAVFVGRVKTSGERFAQLAGAAPVGGVLLVVAVLPFDAGALTLGAFAGAGVLIELSKQWSQSLAMVQARIGARPCDDHRRQATVGLGGNLGALAGTGVGLVAAFAGAAIWTALLLTCALGAWAIQATVATHAPRRLRQIMPGRSRWRRRGKDYIVVTGAYMLGGYWTAIYDADPHTDAIPLDRQRTAFDPLYATVEDALIRLDCRRRPAA